MSAKIPRLSSPQCQDSWKRVKRLPIASRQVEPLLMSLGNCSSWLSKVYQKICSKGLEFHLCQAVDQMVQTAQLLWIPNFKSWNESFIPSQRGVDVGETTQKRVSPYIPKDSVNGDLP
jgi:hypothetical protein